MFGPEATSSEAFTFGLLPPTTGPRVYATGLPPPSSLAPARAETPAPASDWLTKLAPSEIPVRWNPRLVQYLEFYKNDPRGRGIAAYWWRKSAAYEPMIRAILRENNVPQDLMWVAVIESGLRPTVYSSVGAAGLWQFMPEAGRLYGLVIDRWIDERMDPERSTQAAARYLHDLHRRFGTWELALAAYNMGYGGLLASIRKYNCNDFWELSRFEAGLPWETTLYVPKILALTVVAHNLSEFGLSNLRREPPLAFDNVDVAPGLPLSAIAQAAGVALADMEELNPQLLASRVPPRSLGRGAAGLWSVRVPHGRGDRVVANLVRTRSQEPKLEPAVVRQGESLGDLASAHGISERELQQLNALRSDEVPRPGTVLLVPPTPTGAANRVAEKPVVVVAADLPAPPGHRRVFYRVVAGDTLAGIAAALSVKPDELRGWNALDAVARLHEGMTLLALVPEACELKDVATLSGSEVRVLVVGTDEFFAYFEGLRERVRTTWIVRSGDTWRSLSKRTGLSVGMLERINRRARSEELRPGERLTVYVPARTVGAMPAQPAEPEDSEPKPPMDPSIPDDLPASPATDNMTPGPG